MATINILTTTEIYGSLSVNDIYATCSNGNYTYIGVPSGAVFTPAYFQNTGTTDLNHISINGTMKILGTNHLKDTVLPQGFYTNWNDSAYMGETSFINSKGLGTGGFKFYNVGNTVSSSVELASVNENGFVISNNITANNKTDIEALQTKTTNMSYSGGATSFSSSLSAVTYLNASNSNLLQNSSLPQGAYYGWNSSGGLGESNFINSSPTSTPASFYFQNVTKDLSNSCVTLMVINTDGKVGIGTTSPTEKLDVSGNVKCTYLKTSSDYRLKQNVQPLNGEYDISKLKPVQYQMMGKKATGFIAHELQEVFPHLVTGKKDGYEMQSVDYIGMISILTYNLQNLKKEVDELKKEKGKPSSFV